MKTLIRLFLTVLSAATSFAGTPAAQTSKQEEKGFEQVVFVTGSLIPQRVRLRRIGTTTYSPMRIIDRVEIDQTGRQTTAGSLINEPGLRVIGH